MKSKDDTAKKGRIEMSIKTDLAKRKLAEECQGKDELIPFEEYLTNICTNDRVADRILTEGKTIEGCVKAMSQAAEKRIKTRSGMQCVAMTPDEGFEIIREYYGITDGDLSAQTSKPAGIVDITDFL